MLYFYIRRDKEVLMATKDSKERAKPGSKREGDYYHMELRPKTQFKKFCTHDISDSSHERIAGKMESGSWLTQKWLIDKDKPTKAQQHANIKKASQEARPH